MFLLQIRAGLIVSSAIPLAMLVAIIGMRYFGISANLMSLGAIDFGLIVDAAVIIVENCVRRLGEKRRELGRALSGEERRATVREASVEVRKAGQVGEILIIAAYLPIRPLVGIEGEDVPADGVYSNLRPVRSPSAQPDAHTSVICSYEKRAPPDPKKSSP